MNTIGRAACTTTLLCLALVAGGCGYDVEVFLNPTDPGLRDKVGAVKSIQVDLIGVNETEYKRWEEMSINDYIEPGSKFGSSGEKFVMKFEQGKDSKQVLRHSDPKWDQWKRKKATHLFVIANLPGTWQDKPGDADPRRIILPLDAGRWAYSGWGVLTIPIEVRSNGMTPLLQPRKK